MSTINQHSEERRKYKAKGYEYLLFELEKKAWILRAPNLGRRKRYRVPDAVYVEGITYTVESIEWGAFRKAKCLKHLVIPDSIEFVDECNFCSLPSLRSIYIGKGLKYISSWVFQRNKKLRSFVISKENPHMYVENGIVYTTDGKNALTTPFNIRHLRIKEGVEAIDNVAFWWNPNLSTITFPSTLKSIGDNGFAGCTKLRELKLPDGFEDFISQCFCDCTGLETVELPSSLMGMDDETFYRCSNLKTIIIRNTQVLVPKTFRNSPIYLPEGCTLKVPKNLIDEYKMHPLWYEATNVEEIE